MSGSLDLARIAADCAPGLSVVIPTYNPQERIFSRVLNAIESLCATDAKDIECVIVDNKSNPPVSEMRCVQTFLAQVPGARLVLEEAQGLTFARIAGIRSTSGSVIVVFDDDNIPIPEYLQVVRRCMREYPFVAVWGPGNVDVELLDPVPVRLRTRVRAHHGQKKNQFVQYGCVRGAWQQFYPHGMGQVMTRAVAESYSRAVECGQLSSTDRRGGSLASAGDNQIVWHAINMGLAAGLHPDLKLQHLIPRNRTTIDYLRRLTFGCALSHIRALTQSFPDQAEVWRHVPSAPRCGLQLLKVVARSAWRNRLRFLSVDVSELLGVWCAQVTVAGYENHWTLKLARQLKLT